MATGTLGLSACGFLARIFVTHANILTSLRSTGPYDPASPPRESSPTNHIDSAASAISLSPVIFSAQVRLTSELLRFL